MIDIAHNTFDSTAESFIKSQDREAIIIGNYRSGKTMALCAKVHHLCMTYPGISVLLCSEFATHANMIIDLCYDNFFGRDEHGEKEGYLKINKSYSYPKIVYTNGSNVYVSPASSPKWLALEFDFVGVFHADRIKQEEWMQLYERVQMRHSDKIGFAQIAGEISINPNFHDKTDEKINIPSWVFYRNSIMLYRQHLTNNPTVYMDGAYTDTGNQMIELYPNLVDQWNELQYYN